MKDKTKRYFQLLKEIEISRIEPSVSTTSERLRMIREKHKLKEEIMEGLGLLEELDGQT